MGSHNRRSSIRIPLQMFLNEYVNDSPQRCMSLNLAPEGIYLNRLIDPFQDRPEGVGLEFELPGTSEVVWAKGQVVFDVIDKYFHGTGVRFMGMADMHRRMIRDYVFEKREERLRELLSRVRRNRRLRLN